MLTNRYGWIVIVLCLLSIGAVGCAEKTDSASPTSQQEKRSGVENQDTEKWAKESLQVMEQAKIGIQNVGKGFAAWTKDEKSARNEVNNGIEQLEKALSQMKAVETPQAEELKPLDEEIRNLLNEYVKASKDGLQAAEDKNAQQIVQIANKLKELNERTKQWNQKVNSLLNP